MHNETDILSSVIKSARENADITIEALAAKIDISERYIYRIENDVSGKLKPADLGK